MPRRDSDNATTEVYVAQARALGLSIEEAERIHKLARETGPRTPFPNSEMYSAVWRQALSAAKRGEYDFAALERYFEV